MFRRRRGNRARSAVAIHEGEKFNAPALLAMFRQIIADNRAGGWRKLKRGDRIARDRPPFERPVRSSVADGEAALDKTR
jgi:hypothetical protein